MKTIKKITLVIVVMLVSTLSYADKGATKDAIALSNVTVVKFDNVKKGHKLLVKDENGIILHSETVKNNGNLSKLFDLKQLKSGTYTVELDKDFEIIIKSFEIKNNNIVFLTNTKAMAFKPSIRIENNKLLVSQMSLESDATDVEIYYGDNLIYSEAVEGEKTINRIYKLSETETGDYHAIIRTGDRTYVKNFKL